MAATAIPIPVPPRSRPQTSSSRGPEPAKLSLETPLCDALPLQPPPTAAYLSLQDTVEAACAHFVELIEAEDGDNDAAAASRPALLLTKQSSDDPQVDQVQAVFSIPDLKDFFSAAFGPIKPVAATHKRRPSLSSLPPTPSSSRPASIYESFSPSQTSPSVNLRERSYFDLVPGSVGHRRRTSSVASSADAPAEPSFEAIRKREELHRAVKRGEKVCISLANDLSSTPFSLISSSSPLSKALTKFHGGSQLLVLTSDADNSSRVVGVMDENDVAELVLRLAESVPTIASLLDKSIDQAATSLHRHLPVAPEIADDATILDALSLFSSTKATSIAVVDVSENTVATLTPTPLVQALLRSTEQGSLNTPLLTYLRTQHVEGVEGRELVPVRRALTSLSLTAALRLLHGTSSGVEEVLVLVSEDEPFTPSSPALSSSAGSITSGLLDLQMRSSSRNVSAAPLGRTPSQVRSRSSASNSSSMARKAQTTSASVAKVPAPTPPSSIGASQQLNIDTLRPAWAAPQAVVLSDVLSLAIGILLRSQ